MRNSFLLRMSLVVFCLVCTAGAVHAEEFIGSIKTLTGKGYIVRDGERMKIDVGEHIHLHDLLVTAKDSTMGVLFRDNTQAALGPETELSVDEYVFEPTKEELGFVAQMRVGTTMFISGKIGKLAPEKVKVNTPLTTIGTRGTKFVVTVPKEK